MKIYRRVRYRQYQYDFFWAS
eukprot:SAG31_NODE_49890_length_126_cov_99.777778_1_plen_20_part_01